jgi:quinol monooxygenase YgiN
MRRNSPRCCRNSPMHRSLVAITMIMAGLFGHISAALAQVTTAPPVATQPVYVITYVEVAPDFSSEARQLILAHSADVRKASGAVQVDVLQRIDYPNHFALVEQWQSQNARQTHASSEAVVKFRAALGPLQIAPYDDRLQSPLSVGPSPPASADSVMIITHVDVIPASVDAGTGKVRSFVEQGRAAPGNRRFDALVQASRKNHMTIVESWDSLAAKNSWISTPAARSFREELQPMSGSLYDERAYRLLR